MRKYSLYVISFFFIAVGISHFTHTDFFMPLMPPYIPWHLEMIQLSGICEIFGGLGVLFPSTRRIAGWGLMALLVAVFPANLYTAQHPEVFEGVPTWLIYVRLPIQALLLYWVWWTVLKEDHIAGWDTEFDDPSVESRR
jgi:uncharacterized membrane protein